jgi:DNA-binding transcriptional LysR family regulator
MPSSIRKGKVIASEVVRQIAGFACGKVARTAALDGAGVGWTVAFPSPGFAGSVAAVRAGLGVMPLPAGMLPRGLVEADLPGMAEAELALLVRPRAGAAARALAEFVAGRVGAARDSL